VGIVGHIVENTDAPVQRQQVPARLHFLRCAGSYIVEEHGLSGSFRRHFLPDTVSENGFGSAICAGNFGFVIKYAPQQIRIDVIGRRLLCPAWRRAPDMTTLEA
jgi:hypothetical protein